MLRNFAKNKLFSKFSNISDDARRFNRILLAGSAIFVLLLGFVGIGFFYSIQGPEIILVPSLEGLELVKAIEALQEKSLGVYVLTRYSQDESGIIIEQQPKSGSQVRSGRTINVTVSLGPVLAQVGNYVGMSLDELRQSLSTQFVSYEALIEVKNENISYTHSDQPEQIILAQDPEAGEEITRYTELKLLVSSGSPSRYAQSPQTVGLEYREVLGLLVARNIPFIFRFADIDSNSESSRPGIVLRQNPPVGEDITEKLELFISPLDSTDDSIITGIFTTNIPGNGATRNVKVQFINAFAEVSPYFQIQHRGGEFAFPFAHDIESTIQVLIDDQPINEVESSEELSTQQNSATKEEEESNEDNS